MAWKKILWHRYKTVYSLTLSGTISYTGQQWPILVWTWYFLIFWIMARKVKDDMLIKSTDGNNLWGIGHWGKAGQTPVLFFISGVSTHAVLHHTVLSSHLCGDAEAGFTQSPAVAVELLGADMVMTATAPCTLVSRGDLWGNGHRDSMCTLGHHRKILVV